MSFIRRTIANVSPFRRAAAAGNDRDPELAEFREVFARSQRAPIDSVLRASVDDGELPANLDLDGAVAALVGPLLFRRVILAQGVDGAYADELIESYLKAHLR